MSERVKTSLVACLFALSAFFAPGQGRADDDDRHRQPTTCGSQSNFEGCVTKTYAGGEYSNPGTRCLVPDGEMRPVLGTCTWHSYSPRTGVVCDCVGREHPASRS